MEIGRCVATELENAEDNVVSIDKAKLSQLFGFEEKYKEIARVIDTFGRRSAKAQGLPHAITSQIKLSVSKNRCYVIYDPSVKKIAGILKVGKKKLFIRDELGGYVEITPLCVLDFYVHETIQRRGIGSKLFRVMMKRENKSAEDFAYDRPSKKLLSFLKKHFGLVKYTPQANNFVVFKEFFRKRKTNNDMYVPITSPLKISGKSRNLDGPKSSNSSFNMSKSPRKYKNECTYQ